MVDACLTQIGIRSAGERAGLTTHQVLTLLEERADLPFVRMDCSEVGPACDHGELTSAAPAKFVWTYLSGQIAAHHPRRPA
ncbi:MAG: arginase family protein [Rubrivivax sp.]